MDFGLDRLLVALEERFGKKPTDAFVLLLAAGVIVFVVNLIWVDGIQPVGDAFSGHINWDDLGWAFIVWALGLAISFFLLSAFAAWINRRSNKRFEQARQASDQALASIDAAMTTSLELKRVADIAHADFLTIAGEVERDLTTWREAGVQMAEIIDSGLQLADRLDAVGDDPTARIEIRRLGVEHATHLREILEKTIQKMADQTDDHTVVD